MALTPVQPTRGCCESQCLLLALWTVVNPKVTVKMSGLAVRLDVRLD